MGAVEMEAGEGGVSLALKDESGWSKRCRAAQPLSLLQLM